MPKATNTPTTSRRGLLAGSGVGAILAVVGAPAATAQAAAAHPDAALLASCASFATACAGIARVNASPDITNEEVTSIVKAWGAPIDTIINLPATTLEGVRAKAQAVIGFFESGGVDRDKDQPVEETAEYHELMAWRLCHEILAMGSTPA